MSIRIFLVKLCLYELSFLSTCAFNFRFHVGLAWALKSLTICLTFSCYFSSFTNSFALVIKGQQNHFSAKPLQTQTKKETTDKIKLLRNKKDIVHKQSLGILLCSSPTECTRR